VKGGSQRKAKEIKNSPHALKKTGDTTEPVFWAEKTMWGLKNKEILVF